MTATPVVPTAAGIAPSLGSVTSPIAASTTAGGTSPAGGATSAAPVAEEGRPPHRWPLDGWLLAGDAVAGAVAGAVAVSTIPWPPGAAAGRFTFALLGWGVVMVVLAARGVYARGRLQLAPRVADGLLPAVGGLLVAAVSLLALRTVGPFSTRIPDRGIAVLVGADAVLLPMFRAVVLRSARAGGNVRRVLVVGSGSVASDLARKLDRSRLVEVVGLVDDEPADGHAVVGVVEDLPRLCRDHRVDRVVIAFSRRHPSTCAEILLDLEGTVDVDVVVRYYQLAGWESRLHDVAGLSVLRLGRRPGPLAAAVKRLFDIVVAAVLLIVLAPVLLVLAGAVKLSSPGPVLFRQVRLGRHQRPFRIAKFRTMTESGGGGPGDEDLGVGGSLGDERLGVRTPLTTLVDRRRVTGVGRLLRRSALDEIPQLFNVLAGQMSVVGPRPFVPEECAGLDGWAARRFDARPGMTGLWQVCGQHELSFEELCRLDVQYGTSWSIRTDARILAQTPTRLLRGSAPDR